METNISKNQVRKLGDRIKQNPDNVINDDLELLQLYRTSYKTALAEAFKMLTEINPFTEAILSYRVKRIDSIIRKLKRNPQMELDRMWDIVGCRCILKNKKQIDRLESKIRKFFFIIESQTRNYYSEENPSGYKSLHLYVKLTEENKQVIEFQIRTKLDHNWATLVEITDLLFDDNTKETDNYKKSSFGEFHKVLSKRDNLSNIEKRFIIDSVIKTDLYNIVSKTLINNYIDVRSQWVSNKKSKFDNYFVIVTKKDETPNIKSFNSYPDAENYYFNQFKSDHKANVLLTFLKNNSYEQVSIAYSNYILTTHAFLDDFLIIIEEFIIDSVKCRKLRLFRYYFNIYMEINNNLIKELSLEINQIATISKDKENRQRIKEWEEELKKKIVKKTNENVKTRKNIKIEINNMPFIIKILFLHALRNVINKNYNNNQK